MQKQKKVTRGRDSCQMSWISNLLQPVSHTSAVAAYQHGAMQTQINDKHCARIHRHTQGTQMFMHGLSLPPPPVSQTPKISNEACFP